MSKGNKENTYSLPLKIGRPPNNSANMQPTDHLVEGKETRRKNGKTDQQESVLEEDKMRQLTNQ